MLSDPLYLDGLGLGLALGFVIGAWLVGLAAVGVAVIGARTKRGPGAESGAGVVLKLGSLPLRAVPSLQIDAADPVGTARERLVGVDWRLYDAAADEREAFVAALQAREREGSPC